MSYLDDSRVNCQLSSWIEKGASVKYTCPDHGQKTLPPAYMDLAFSSNFDAEVIRHLSANRRRHGAWVKAACVFGLYQHGANFELGHRVTIAGLLFAAMM
jgi:hypothetical protein